MGYDRLREMLKDTKEDTPVSCGMFREFLDNHFAHLKRDVLMNKRLSYFILGAILTAIIVNLFRG